MKFKFRHLARELLAEYTEADKWREKYRIKEGEHDGSVRHATLVRLMAVELGLFERGDDHETLLEKLGDKAPKKEGELRLNDMGMSHHARAERTMFIRNFTRDEIVKIQDYEQRRFWDRFMCLEEMNRLTGKHYTFPRPTKEQYEYLRVLHKDNKPDLKNDDDLRDGMNFEHAWDWIIWHKAIDLPAALDKSNVKEEKKKTPFRADIDG